MSYPGDPNLAADIQQRILTTFQQTLELASKGSRQEALLGCDFILRLDAQFGPARTLQQMVNAGRSGPELAELFGDSPQGGAARESASSGPAGIATAAIDARLRELVDRGDLAGAIAMGEREIAAVRASPALQDLLSRAQSRLEAEPYVRTFLDSARQAIAAGDAAEADRLLRKARSLDAEHPEIARLEAERASISPIPAIPEKASDGLFDLPDVDFSLGGDNPSFSDAPAGGENVSRIQELLVEGQGAFDRGEFQGAIDAWSRIFLIDIDHHEAARRIEEARRLKAEREREVEELFHGGVAQFDAADFAAAERSFRRVLEIAPGYLMAHEYLEKIEQRRTGAPAPAPVMPPVGAASEAATLEMPRPGRGGRDRSGSEILVPPEPGAARSKPRDERPGYGVAAKRRGGPSPKFALIGGGVLALLLVGGWLLLQNRASLFPNAKESPATPAPAVADPLERAKTLHAEGKTAIALAQLRRLPPQDPQYAEAQSLISQWEALIKPAEPVPAGLAPEARAKRDAFLASAERACREGENLRCQRLLQQAAAIQPLDATQAALAAAAAEKLSPLAAEMKIFSDGDWEDALNRLWRMREAEPGNRDVRQLIVDAYYNLGVLELQRGDPAAAADRFREAKGLDGGDPELERLESFAITYTQRADDLLYQIFSRNLVNR